jgi:hypothetical protein
LKPLAGGRPDFPGHFGLSILAAGHPANPASFAFRLANPVRPVISKLLTKFSI